MLSSENYHDEERSPSPFAWWNIARCSTTRHPRGAHPTFSLDQPSYKNTNKTMIPLKEKQ
jgi:hypothetical protein